MLVLHLISPFLPQRRRAPRVLGPPTKSVLQLAHPVPRSASTPRTFPLCFPPCIKLMSSMSSRVAGSHSLGGDLRRRAAELRRLGQLADAVRTADQTHGSTADQTRPSGHGSAHTAAATSYLGQLVEAHCPPLPLPIDSVMDALGGLGFTLGMLARSWYGQLRGSSNTALVTLVACAFVLAPFLFMSSAILLLGLACCLPVMLTGLAVAWLPTALRAAWTAADTLRGWVTAQLESAAAADGNVAGMCGGNVAERISDAISDAVKDGASYFATSTPAAAPTDCAVRAAAHPQLEPRPVHQLLLACSRTCPLALTPNPNPNRNPKHLP